MTNGLDLRASRLPHSSRCDIKDKLEHIKRYESVIKSHTTAIEEIRVAIKNEEAATAARNELWRKAHKSKKPFDSFPDVGAHLPPGGVAVIGYKSVFLVTKTDKRVVQLKLLIPADSKRQQLNPGSKCRAERVKVLGVVGKTKLAKGNKLRSYWSKDGAFFYQIGKYAKPTKKFNPSIKSSCASGIHFFLTLQGAKDFAAGHM